ncbi:hypothetical protein AB0I93_02675 [Streptomyces sp. NPDC049967]|uniref:hypothetical protein n=1 Tax=unclassified Streptomyces TaxID=2593676 RepID=UPI002E15A9D0|nr:MULTISPECIES: hypothetical protein [unclassified Streptomyces]WSJ20507.1 hypothetical protein OG384_00085 [Streptomyces sp. NBC_01324]
MLKNLLRAGAPVALAALTLTPTGPAHAVDGSAAHRANPCATVIAPLGSVCVPAPKQCFTTPCYQYDIVPILSVPWPPAGPRTG